MTVRPPSDRHRRALTATSPPSQDTPKTLQHFAIVGAGIAGIACARTLQRAGHRVTVFERDPTPGGRMASERTPFGRFDSGAQYFTVRDPRFAEALETAPGICKRWSANAVRVLDAHGRVAAAAPPANEAHWVALPGMDALAAHWAVPLGEALRCDAEVTRIETDPLDRRHWQLRMQAGDGAQQVASDFDAVLLALPPTAARRLLHQSALAGDLQVQLERVVVAPCWTLMLAFPHAAQPNLPHLGPQWNAARSTHHRAAWLARESSKPGRDTIERWTLQASAAWSEEHQRDDAPRVEAKLLRAFAEITGILATPAWVRSRRWAEAKTETALGAPHLWDSRARIGVAGDWCIGHRVEDAFLSGLSLALAVA
ncbi:MAG: FAD-dependent oxidoreductase [Variovorax sp.]